ncbi:MAG TPA: hypothetical protein VKU00_28395, partial [Chthonomonadaceae bacterium]|nr:hypothetical protein [Chthonomonadaceae bacterium]
LQMAAGFSYPLPDGRQAGMTGGEQGWGNPLVSAQSPAIASPNNARENAALRQAPALQHLVSLRPKSSCPRLKQGNPSGESEDRGATQEEFEAANHPIPTPHITSADAWEEVHKQTGLPIVADYYTRLYPVSAATVSNAPLFEALSKVTDALGIRWTQDGGLLLGRSTSWYWDKLKEPSNTLLDSLQAYGRGGADLPFEALFQIAALSDAQLDSERVAQGIQHCRELDAWSLVTANTGGWRDFYVMRRAILRALSTSSPEQRETLQSPTGLAFNALGPGQQQGLIAALHTMNFLPSTLLGSHIRLEYVPSGRYVWRPRRALAPHDNGERLPLVTGRTLQEALTNARLVDAAATEANIARTRGILALTVFAGNDMAWSWGRPMPH